MIATGVTLTQTGIGFIPILGGHIYNGGLDRITHPLRNDHQAHILKGHTGQNQAAEDNRQNHRYTLTGFAFQDFSDLFHFQYTSEVPLAFAVRVTGKDANSPNSPMLTVVVRVTSTSLPS